MPAIDSYDAQTMSVNFSWLPELTGIERIMLSAQGDLQRLLSAFFDHPIAVSLIYSNTLSAPQTEAPTPLSLLNAAGIPAVSRESILIQTRQVNLLCASQIVCTATSTVRISSPECARLFIAEKYAIGQVFRELERPPRFELVAVGVGRNVAGEDGKVPEIHTMKQHQLWRKYLLYTDGFECEILEVFPTREMFVGNRWLDDQLHGKTPSSGVLSLDVLLGAIRLPVKVLLVAVLWLLLLRAVWLAFSFYGF